MNAPSCDFVGENSVVPSDLMTVVNQPDDAQNIDKAVELTNDINIFMRNLLKKMEGVQTRQIRLNDWKK